MVRDRINARVENVDIQLKKVKGELKVYGRVGLNFDCEECHLVCQPTLSYDGENPDREYRCEYCDREYLISVGMIIRPEVLGGEAVEVVRQMQPVIDKIKRGGIIR